MAQSTLGSATLDVGSHVGRAWAWLSRCDEPGHDSNSLTLGNIHGAVIIPHAKHTVTRSSPRSRLLTRHDSRSLACT